MRIKIKRKKLLILVPFVLFGLLVWAFLKLNLADFARTNVLGIDSQQIGLIRDNPTNDCDLSETIEYFYYDSNPYVSRSNNKVGLYVYAERLDFIKLADDLVNSNGGDWGYVLIPYNVKDYDRDKWSTVFETLHQEHLIPIIQLHDVDMDEFERQTKRSAEFLDSMVWPVKPRYISVYNEPNDSKFWYGEVKPQEYANVLNETIKIFKEQNGNFLIMNGGLNASAPNDDLHMDSFDFMRSMNEAVPGIFDKLDAWASHSYPQPNFSGGPYDGGRWSIRAYDSELKYLKEELGVERDLPVFITETGWAHSEGTNGDLFYSAEKVAEFFKIAYEEIWLPDDRVIAVTPFTIWYEPPFDHFSWVNEDEEPYPQFEVVKSIKKVAGNPPKLTKGTVSAAPCPDEIALK